MQGVDEDGMGVVGPVFRQVEIIGGQVRKVVPQERLIVRGPEAQHRNKASRADERRDAQTGHRRRSRRPAGR